MQAALMPSGTNWTSASETYGSGTSFFGNWERSGSFAGSVASLSRALFLFYQLTG
jgi:hypothetical protein